MRARVPIMTTRGTVAIALFAFGFGLIVLLGEGLPELRQGRTVFGSVITACGAIGTVMGLVALVLLLRRGRPKRSEPGAPEGSP
jgi:hypothetical protein